MGKGFREISIFKSIPNGVCKKEDWEFLKTKLGHEE